VVVTILKQFVSVELRSGKLNYFVRSLECNLGKDIFKPCTLVLKSGLENLTAGIEINNALEGFCQITSSKYMEIYSVKSLRSGTVQNFSKIILRRLTSTYDLTSNPICDV
jgi:hypothetical protein